VTFSARSGLTLFLLICFLAKGNAQNGKLNLGSDVWPPFTNVDDELSTATDLVDESLRRIGYQSTTKIADFTEVMQSLENGNLDGCTAIWKNDSRSEFLLFSAPYLTNQLVLVGKKGSDVSASNFLDLQGQKIGVVGSYDYGAKVNLENSVAFIEGSNDQENLNRLLAEEVDYILVDALLVQYLMKYQQGDVATHLEVGRLPLITRNLHFAVRKDLDSADLIISRFNEEILKMLADGSYNEILRIHQIMADVNGDGIDELVVSPGSANGAFDESFYYAPLSVSGMKKGNSKVVVKGKYYQSWEEVPDEYKKVEYKQEDLNVSLLKFNF
jgi:polar amino acid transport system substrate-binding protein